MRNNNGANRNNNNYNKDSHPEGGDARGGGRGQGSGGQHDRRKQDQSQRQGFYNQNRNQHQNQGSTDRSNNRDYRENHRDQSGNRDRSGQHPDSSMGRGDGYPSQAVVGTLGAIKFNPGMSTRELPPIETKPDTSKKFAGRCRLFVGNLPHNTSEEKVKKLFEPFGEIGEIYLGAKSAFGFVKMDTRQSAEAARDALDCTLFEGRSLRVRLAAHAAAIRVKHLSPYVTNELLAYAFRYFGEVERAVVVVDDKGKSIGEGIVEFSRKQAAQFAIKKCQQEAFLLTASPQPVLVEAYDQRDEDEGLPEKSVNKNSNEFKDQRDIGPRFAEHATFEHTFGLRWKELYALEKQKRDLLDQEIQKAQKGLEDQIEYSRLEHDTMQLRSKLQQLEDMKMRQMKEQGIPSYANVQQGEDQRRQHDMMMTQKDDEIMRRQQLSDSNCINQQESALRSQARAMQEMLSTQDTVNDGNNIESSQSQQKSQMGQESEHNMPFNQVIGQGPRTFADAAMMGVTQPYMQVQAPQLSIHAQNSNPPNIYQGYIPPPPIQATMNAPSAGSNLGGAYQQMAGYSAPMNNDQQNQGGGNVRQRFNKQQFNNQGNNINLVGAGRPRKRGRF